MLWHRGIYFMLAKHSLKVLQIGSCCLLLASGSTRQRRVGFEWVSPSTGLKWSTYSCRWATVLLASTLSVCICLMYGCSYSVAVFILHSQAKLAHDVFTHVSVPTCRPNADSVLPSTLGPKDQNTRDTRTQSQLCSTAVVYNENPTIYGQSVLMLRFTALSSTFISFAMHTEDVRQSYFKVSSNLFDSQSSLMSVLQSQTGTHKAVNRLRWLWPLTPGPHIVSSLACKNYSWVLQCEERIKDASGSCEITWYGVKGVLCVYNSRLYGLQKRSRNLELRTLTQVAFSCISVIRAKCNTALKSSHWSFGPWFLGPWSLGPWSSGPCTFETRLLHFVWRYGFAKLQ